MGEGRRCRVTVQRERSVYVTAVRPPSHPCGSIAGMLTQRQLERFWSKVDKSGECWIWTGGRDYKNYGRMRYPGDPTRWIGAHRFAYLVTMGSLPDLVLDHLCSNPPCVNPAHLEPVTQAENLARSERTLSGRLLRRTHFGCGCEITTETILWEGTSRRCRKHRGEYVQSYRRRTRE